MEINFDVGKGMLYCKKHMYWRKAGTKCEECEKDKIRKLENE